MFIVVESVDDAYKLSKAYPEIKEINLGGIKAKEDTKNIGKAVNITSKEERLLNELTEQGVKVEIRQVPSDKKIDITEVL